MPLCRAYWELSQSWGHEAGASPTKLKFPSALSPANFCSANFPGIPGKKT